MIVRSFPSQAAAQPDGESGTISHSRRVAAWCEELGRTLKLSPQELGALCNAGLAHHRPDLLGGSALGRLISDLGVCLINPDTEMPLANPMTEAIIEAYQNKASPDCPPRIVELARLLECANAIDEQLEYAPYEQSAPEDPVAAATDAEDMIGFAIRHLRVCSRDDLRDALPKLPVYPAVAMRLYRMLQTDVNLSVLENIARMDPVIAGKLVKAANSAFYSPSQPIRTVTQAISYVGTEDARRILLASSIQPIYSSPRMRKLWKHALEAAQVAERIADLSGKIDPGEAFLLGLLHDVGKLSISLMSKQVNEVIDRLLAKGCQPAAAETVLCGFDHAYAGAEALRHWRFEDELIGAVKYHHQPERSDSRLASVLYLTEFWTDSEEDLPSNARLTTALQSTTLTVEALEVALTNVRSVVTSL